MDHTRYDWKSPATWNAMATGPTLVTASNKSFSAPYPNHTMVIHPSIQGITNQLTLTEILNKKQDRVYFSNVNFTSHASNYGCWIKLSTIDK
jgi:ATP-dependent protease ClpP protease subunit